MLLVLVEVKRLLDLVTEALAIRGLGVSSVLFLVNVASTAALRISQYWLMQEAWLERTPVWNSS
jgi:hypothetical protein